jgi:pimeloyl-ACP methyl ester carboxylesterase
MQPSELNSVRAPIEHELDLPCGITCYLEAGRGFPVVLLHGLLGYSFAWRKNIGALAEHFRVLAPDLGGCGHSAPLRDGAHGVEQWSRQLEEFLDALDILRAHVLGTSAGGAVALDFAARRPERVERLVLVAPVNPFSRRVVFLARAYAATGMPTPVMNALCERAPRLYPWLFRHRYYFDPGRITPETIPGYLEGLRVNVTVPMLRQAIRRWKPAAMARQLSGVKAPVLLLWGAEDKLVPVSSIPRLAKALPNSTVVTIRGAGHFVYEELPEAFNEQVIRFLRKPPETP